jgi:hypothetical protein
MKHRATYSSRSAFSCGDMGRLIILFPSSKAIWYCPSQNWALRVYNSSGSAIVDQSKKNVVLRMARNETMKKLVREHIVRVFRTLHSDDYNILSENHFVRVKD